MEYIVKRRQDLKTGAWTGGRTTELFICPPEARLELRNFIARVSSATVEQDESEFSDFSGFVRHIMPLEGRMKLVFGDSRSVDLGTYESYTFDGGIPVKSFGRCVDFNLIHTPDWKGSLWAVSNSGTFTCDPKGFAVFFAVRDGVSVAAATDDCTGYAEVLNYGDLFLMSPSDFKRRGLRIRGENAVGEIVMVMATIHPMR
ncbi:MAG: HutD family protein [Synergistaceae bacterium]|jgi:environmental stress-induced protein Ves|nr:HutD family protein [Synergistaceae bacterium]